jgi:hypothetical protein
MTDTEIDKQVAALQATIEWLRGQKRVPDAPPVAPLDPGPPGLELSDLIEAGDAAALVRKAKSTVASWCRSNAISGADGFAVKVGGRWLVSKSRLLKHLASVSRD